MTTYEQGRKPHVHVDADTILAALRETGGGLLPDIAEHFEVSTMTARRKLDGLVARGQARVVPGVAGHPDQRPGMSPHAWYEPVPPVEPA